MIIAGRPISIWIVLAFLAYGAVGTTTALTQAARGLQSYSTSITTLSAFVVLLSVVLMVFIWIGSKRMFSLALVFWGTSAFIQILGALSWVPILQSELSTAAQQNTVYVFTAVMVVLYGLVPFFVYRFRKKAIGAAA